MRDATRMTPGTIVGCVALIAIDYGDRVDSH
jgi:hypothetical protein